MKVTINSPISLGNKAYEKGSQEIPDSLYANQAFVKLVKSGVIVVHPRDAQMQKAQASKDARALSNAQLSKEAAEKTIAARAELVNNKAIGANGAPVSQADRERAQAQADAEAQAQAAPMAPAEQVEEPKSEAMEDAEASKPAKSKGKKES